MLPSFTLSPFFVAFFPYSHLFEFNSFYDVLLHCCTLFIIEPSFHVAIFCSNCTHLMLHSFKVEPFSYCTFFMLLFFPAAFYSYYTYSMFHFSHTAFFFFIAFFHVVFLPNFHFFLLPVFHVALLLR